MTGPTDAELLAEWDRVSHIADAGQRRLSCLHAVLAKWGTPPAVAGKPVAWYEYNADLDAWFLAYRRNPKAKTRPLVFGDATPQAGAVPLTLTKEQRRRIVLTADTVSEAIDMVERHYGIKGGQHGAE